MTQCLLISLKKKTGVHSFVLNLLMVFLYQSDEFKKEASTAWEWGGGRSQEGGPGRAARPSCNLGCSQALTEKPYQNKLNSRKALK